MARKTAKVIGVACALTVVAGLMIPAMAGATDRPSIPIAIIDGAQRTPDIGGRWVAWADERYGGDQIWVYDLGLGEVRQLTSGGGKKAYPSVTESGAVVAEDYRNGVTSSVFSWDIRSGAETTVAVSSIFDCFAPAASGPWTTWADLRNGNYDIYAFNSVTQETVAIETDGYRQDEPSVSGDRVVWTDTRQSAGSWGDIWATSLSDGSKKAICDEPSIQLNPSVSGDRAVWQDYRNDNYDVYAYDFVTGTESVVCTESHTQSAPRVSGDWVVWQDDRNGTWDIFARNLETGREVPVCTAVGDQTLPRVAGSWVVWQDSRVDVANDIYAARLDAAADLAEVTVSGPAIAVPASSVGVNVAVRNQGDAACPSANVGVYMSSDASIDRADVRVATLDLGPVDAGTSVSRALSFVMPGTVPFGRYYLGVIADPDGNMTELNESDNFAVGNAVNVVATAHDMFLFPAKVSGGMGQVTGDSNVGAGKEPGEPNHGGKPGGSSVWYRWTAPRSGWVSFSTRGSQIDTLLSVYKGTAVNALVTVARNDDVAGGLQSSVRFRATAGTAYRIAVDGVAREQGSLRLSWRMDDKLSLTVPTRARPGALISARGTVWPAHAGRVTVQVLRRSGASWVNYKRYTVAAKVTTSSAAYSAKIRLRAGTWRIRAYHSDVGRRRVYSAVRTIRVR